MHQPGQLVGSELGVKVLLDLPEDLKQAELILRGLVQSIVGEKVDKLGGFVVALLVIEVLEDSFEGPLSLVSKAT